MQWFRVYNEILDDPKVAKMDGETFRCFIYLLAISSEQETDGIIDMSISDISWRIRIPINTLEAAIAYFLENNILKKENGSFIITNWKKRQFASDNSANRVLKYRNKRQALGMPKGSTYDSKTILQRDHYACVYCGSTNNLCVDHVFPITQGGTDDSDNLVCSCKLCNSGKAGRTPDQAGYKWLNIDACNRYNKYMTQLQDEKCNLTDTDTDTDTEQREGKRSFSQPSLDDVSKYCQERKNSVDPQMFIDFYTAKNWMIGKNKMKDWKAAVRTWEQRNTTIEKKASW
jgi:hypothetical protein